METENEKVNIVVTRSPKSMGAAIALALFFGPLGMFYSTILGAIIMIFVNLIVGLLTFGLGLLITVPIGAIWAAIATGMYNRKLISGRI
jgi:hypothetical protein